MSRVSFLLVGVFLDTIVICTLSGFVVIMAHCWSGNEAAQWEALDKLGKFNASVAQLTPGTAMNNVMTVLVSFCFCLFAYTCLIGMITFSEIAANRISRSMKLTQGIRYSGHLHSDLRYPVQSGRVRTW